MTVTIVTPWFGKRAELERDYWAAVRAAGPCEVLIIDNGSDPPLPNAWRLDENAGFARASNIGLRLATTDAVLFLNNDIAATKDAWLEPLAAELEPGVLIGAEIRYDPHGDVDGVPLPYLGGWCLAGMTEDLLELGGFDEAFEEPSYYGDNDLCFRARLAGMTLREVRAGLVHKENVTAGRADDPKVAAATRANYLLFSARVRDALTLA